MGSKVVAIRLRWIWDGRGLNPANARLCNTVAIRFRWIWVGKLDAHESIILSESGRNPLSLDMGWKEVECCSLTSQKSCRNPLSLDMGWKSRNHGRFRQLGGRSQSAFAGYGLESILSK